jgi:hypothetical protein
MDNSVKAYDIFTVFFYVRRLLMITGGFLSSKDINLEIQYL